MGWGRTSRTEVASGQSALTRPPPKVCPVCRRELSLQAFPLDHTKASGRMSRCRECDNCKSRRYYAQNTERVRTRQNARNAELRLERGPRICDLCDQPAVTSRHRYCATHRRIKRDERLQGRGSMSPEALRRARQLDDERQQRYREEGKARVKYGRPHARVRAEVARVVARGDARCARCGLAIDPAEPWDLDHTDDRSGYLGPSHRRCNRATAGRSRRKTSRVW